MKYDPRQELLELLAARNPLIAISSRDEQRVEKGIVSVARSKTLDMAVQFWSCASGFTNMEGNPLENIQEPDAALGYIMQWGSPCIFVLRDFHPYLDMSMPPNVQIVRMVRDMGRMLKGAGPDSAFKAVVLLSPSLTVPDELQSEVTSIRWPLPDRDDMGKILDSLCAEREDLADSVAGVRDAMVEAALGLTAIEAENSLARAIVLGDLSPQVVLKSKRQAVERSGVVRWKEPPAGGLDWVGGLDALKAWLRLRRRAFSPAARAAGLPAPKGVMVFGHPGTGKSLIAECAAATWGVPIITPGQIQGSLLGESQNNMDQVFEIAEATAPCILFIDEAEKFFGGVGGSGDTDGGVKKELFGKFLTWMQQRRESPVFVIATANNVEALPPELLRKGRLALAA